MIIKWKYVIDIGIGLAGVAVNAVFGLLALRESKKHHYTEADRKDIARMVSEMADKGEIKPKARTFRRKKDWKQLRRRFLDERGKFRWKK